MKIEGIGSELGLINSVILLLIILAMAVLKWGWPWHWGKNNPGKKNKTLFSKNNSMTLVRLKQEFDDCKKGREEIKRDIQRLEERVGGCEQGIAQIKGKLGIH